MHMDLIHCRHKKNISAAVLIFLLGAMLTACGGGDSGDESGGGSPSPAPVNSPGPTLTITPSLGQFAAGATVNIRTLDGELIKSGVVNDQGVASISIPADATPPFLIEAGISGDQFFDEKQKAMVTIELPEGTSAAIRALVPTARTNVGVTTLTEIAVGLIEALPSGGISMATADDIIAANNTVWGSLGRSSWSRATADDSPILTAPALVTKDSEFPPAGTDAPNQYARLLAGLSFMAAPGKNAMNVAHDLRDDFKDGFFDLHIGAIPSILPGYSVAWLNPDDITAAVAAESLDPEIVTAATAAAKAKGEAIFGSCSMGSPLPVCVPPYWRRYSAAMSLSIRNALAQKFSEAVTAYNPADTDTAFHSDIRADIVSLMQTNLFATQYRARSGVTAKLFAKMEDGVNIVAIPGTRLDETVFSDGILNSQASVDAANQAIAQRYESELTVRTPGTACQYGLVPPYTSGHYGNAGDCLKGAPTSTGGSGSGSGSSGYQCPTTKTPFDPDWIQSHGSYWAAASAHDGYTECLKTKSESECHIFYTTETQYCSYAVQACLVVATSASDCPG